MAWGMLGRLLDIHNAARMGNVGRVKDLLRKDPSLVGARDKTGNTPLHCTIGYFELGVVEELLTHKADVNARDSKGIHLKIGELLYLITRICMHGQLGDGRRWKQPRGRTRNTW